MHIEQDLYEMLGIAPDAKTREIKEAYRILARQYHPDRNPTDPGAHKKMEELNEAYEILSNPSRRRDYDLPRGYCSVTPNFGKGVAVKVNSHSKTPYRDHVGVVDSEPTRDSFRFWYMVRFDTGRVSAVSRFAEEELTVVDN